MTLEKLNALRARNGKTQLSSWKNGKAKLAEAIAKEEALLTDLTDVEVGQTEEPVASDLSDVEGRTDTVHIHTIMAEVGQRMAQGGDLPIIEEKIPRGAINAMCVELLQTDMPYEDIVAAIKERYPTAKTTARSLASVAMDLRADGLVIPTRRKPAAAKPAKTEGEA